MHACLATVMVQALAFTCCTQDASLLQKHTTFFNLQLGKQNIHTHYNHPHQTSYSKMDNETMRLTYEHRANGRDMVPNGISLMTEYDLVLILSKHDDVRMVSKKIKPGCTSIEIYKSDLMTEEEKVAAAKANKNDEVPWMVFLGHLWEGHSFDELTILVPEVVAKGGKEGAKQ